MQVRQGGETNWIFTIVYACPHQQEREPLWTELQLFRATVQQPWLLADDFNKTVSLKERNGGVEILRRCDKFENWIENNSFIDLGFSGYKFTWVKGNNEATQKRARLDRALCNVEW